MRVEAPGYAPVSRAMVLDNSPNLGTIKLALPESGEENILRAGQAPVDRAISRREDGVGYSSDI